ncbi:MAG: hypothetical protein HFF14_02735 [Angelakisella sp.]|jgi:hypothetical protein|nr:hypothetical protein [Angelakisella sp.]
MQSSAARVLEEYEYSREYHSAPKQEAPKLQVREGKRTAEGISPLRLLCCFALLVALISLAIYNNIVMVELGDQLNDAKAQLEELQSESVQLRSKLENQSSVQNIESYASATLGMGRAEKYQITYINMEGEGSIYRTDKAPDKAPAQVLLRGFDSLMEYMKLR